MAMLSPNRLFVPASWRARLATALLWAMAAASLSYWLSRLTGPGASTPVAVLAVKPQLPSDGPAQQAALAHLLGARPQAPIEAASPATGQRFALLGVIASRTGDGAALIAVDGQPALPWRVGAQVAPGYVLSTLSQREAVLLDSARPPAKIVLRLPALETQGAANLGSDQTLAAPPAEPVVTGAPNIAESDAPDAEAEPQARLDSRYPAASGARR